MNAGNGRRRLLTRDERVLWSQFTRTIDPLRAASAAADDSYEAPKTADAIGLAQRAKAPAQEAGTPPRTSKKAPALTPLGRRLRQRVARGREAIDGRLDLHGLTQSEAHAALLHFLHDASLRRARLVLVITGKGVRQQEQRGVLRRQVPLWLALPEFRAFVVGFEQAHVSHGGEGAIYVRIRRPAP